MAGVVRTEIDLSKAPPQARWEIADLRLRERSLQEGNEVGDFVSNHVASIEDINTNYVKMRLYQGAAKRFPNLPVGMVRIFVDASIRAELEARHEVAAARAKLKRASSEKIKPVVSLPGSP